ncbi:MAG: transporter [Ferruginibacter sp.]
MDRPDQTECVATVPKKYVQVETGFVYEDLGSKSSSTLMPTILLKYGVTDRFELRVITEVERVKQDSKQNTGINPVKIGFKTKLLEEKNILPAISFLGHLSLPKIASKDNTADFYAPSFRFSFQHTLSSKVSLGYNIGAEWDGFTPTPYFLYTISTAYSVTEKFGAFVELYGFVPQDEISDHHADAGFTYLLSNNLAIDISGGINLSNHSPGYFIGAGFSFRFK